MNQQFSVEYLRINPYRYRRLPSLNATGNQIFNLSQEMITSRTKKNLVKPKLQALSYKKEDSKNFYHHSTIYNVKEYKELSKVQDQQENYLTKYTEMQTKIMVADFKKKVDAFLKKNNQKTNMIGSKITSSLHELESFQSMNNEEQLNKSLCSNKYTIRTEYKSMKATEILVISNNKLISRQIISSELIQQRLLKQMENFLKDDKFNYDLKMQTMIEQYEEIVKKIRQQAYTVKLPQNYQIQMSDYNEFYQNKEDLQIPILNDKLDLLTDQIIQEIQQSRLSTPPIQDQINEELQEELSSYIDEVVKTEPVYLQEEETPKQTNWKNEQVRERKISQRQTKPRQKKQQLQSNQQQQNGQTLDVNNLKSQQSNESDLPEVSVTQQFQQRKETRDKKTNQQIIEPSQVQQQNNIKEEANQFHQSEVIQNKHSEQNNNKRNLNIEKQKGKVHSRKITGENIPQKQEPNYIEVPYDYIVETSNEVSHSEIQQFEEIQVKQQEHNKQEHQQVQQPENQHTDQFIEEQDNQLTDIHQTQEQIIPSSNNKILNNLEQRDAVDIWDNSRPVEKKLYPKPKIDNQQLTAIETKQQQDNYTQQKVKENEDLNFRKSSENQDNEQNKQGTLNQDALKHKPTLDILQPRQVKDDSYTKQLEKQNKEIINDKIEQQKDINEEIVEQKEKVEDHSIDQLIINLYQY